MSDYSPTHWLKDGSDNVSLEVSQANLPIIEIEPPNGDTRIIKNRFVQRLAPRNGRDCYLICVSIQETIIPISYFQPEKWAVDKNTLRNTIDALQAGLEHTRSALTEHDSSLGRTTRKNKSWAETIESDICAIEKSIKDLKLVEVKNTTTYK